MKSIARIQVSMEDAEPHEVRDVIACLIHGFAGADVDLRLDVHRPAKVGITDAAVTKWLEERPATPALKGMRLLVRTDRDPTPDMPGLLGG